MRIPVRPGSTPIAAAVLLLLVGAARAGSSADMAHRAVLATVDALFSAMATHDVEASRRLFVPGATLIVVRADGTVVTEHDRDYLGALATQTGQWRERIRNPQVLVRGDLAQVWAPYDFHLDGKLSHCGTDSFTLVHGNGGWRIASISYTVQKQGCVWPTAGGTAR